MPIASAAPGIDAPVIRGIDHVNLAVGDLDSAATQFRRMGFALKPGRAHPNGIRNWHVKFPDGTEIELISVDAGRDALTREYRRLIEAGNGPAFLALYAPDRDALTRRLSACDFTTETGPGIITFPVDHGLRYLFFGGRNRSPTDEAAHFAHTNTARSVRAISVAKPDLRAENELLTCLGLDYAPDGRTVLLPEGRLQFTRVDSSRYAGRPIRRIELEVADRAATLRILRQNGVPFLEATGPSGAIDIEPRDAFGVFLRFRPRREAP
jgi:catechol 2,3-dioxygenase-like lactoylglutathione lyase family enzyme